MCNALTTTPTGIEILQTLKGQDLGYFDASRIDADIAAKGDASEVRVALLDLQQFVTTCQVDTDALSARQCVALRQALLWYAAWRYRRFEMHHIRSKEECTERDYRALAYACRETKENLDTVAPCLVGQFEDNVERNPNKCAPEYDADLFGGEVVIDCPYD